MGQGVSTDWNVHCVTCGSTHGFDDANHQDVLMSLLCKHAKSIASIADLIAADPHIALKTLWGDIDASWFRAHADHQLVPISEYGHLLDQCAEYIECICGTRQRCKGKRDHVGQHHH